MVTKNTISVIIGKLSLFFIFSYCMVSCSSSEPDTSTAYISQVFEYVYGPGQQATIAK